MLEFSDGLAVVDIKGGQGYIDRTGQIVIPPKLRDQESISNWWDKTVGSCLVRL